MTKRMLLLAVASSVMAGSCPVPYEVMYGIAKVERHPKRAVGYPYIISINSKRLAREVKKYWSHYFIDNRSIDCMNARTCEYMVSQLIAVGIDNIDLGPYQINYKWHRYPVKEYFRLDTSYARACEILMQIVKNHGWNWDSIGKYHSFTKRHYKKYANLVRKFIVKEKK